MRRRNKKTRKKDLLFGEIVASPPANVACPDAFRCSMTLFRHADADVLNVLGFEKGAGILPDRRADSRMVSRNGDFLRTCDDSLRLQKLHSAMATSRRAFRCCQSGIVLCSKA